MAAGATGVRIVFFGSHKQPSYVVETCCVPNENELQDGEVLIKILLATICPLDLDHIDGKQTAQTPCVLGHEGVGEIISSRRTVNGIPTFCPGDRVVFTLEGLCGRGNTCSADSHDCSHGYIKCNSSVCNNGNSMNGCYSSHMILKQSSHIVCIPSNVSNAAASPANCALATMVHALSFLNSDQSKQPIAVVQGANILGLYGCALLHEAGFQKIYCHDISSNNLRLVPMFNGIPVLIEKDNDYAVGPEPGPNSADVVIDVCGAWEVVPHGVNVLRQNGIYIFVGIPHREHVSLMSIDTIIKKGITVKGIQGYKSSHLEEAINFLSHTSDLYPYESLISAPFALQEFHSAVNMARAAKFHRTAVTPQTMSTIGLISLV